MSKILKFGALIGAYIFGSMLIIPIFYRSEAGYFFSACVLAVYSLIYAVGTFFIMKSEK